ncbi:MAG TPA: hypothetical protein VIM62_13600 [Acidobacteriaceae bacterium]
MPAITGARTGHKAPVRATQGLVSHMGYCRNHPSLWAIEILWRWLAGAPFLFVIGREAQRILAQVSPATAGLTRLEWANPWLSSVLIADAIGRYQPLVVGVLVWLAPLAIAGWAVLSGIGRVAILDRMVRIDGEQGSYRSLWRKLPGVVLLQAVWMAALLACWWVWYASVGWAASRYITVGTQPDLVGYLCWLIFLSLMIYVLWAMTSWTLGVAPVVYVMERRSLLSALGVSFRLGKELSGKLAEVNLVMAIVKIALIVLAMVFSAAPLPFSDTFGPEFMHALYWIVAAWWLVANDYFHVVRLRSFVALRRVYR